MRCQTVFVTDAGHGDIWELLVHFYVGQPCVSDIMKGAESGAGRGRGVFLMDGWGAEQQENLFPSR